VVDRVRLEAVVVEVQMLQRVATPLQHALHRLEPMGRYTLWVYGFDEQIQTKVRKLK
jgi:hypothetical protein